MLVHICGMRLLHIVKFTIISNTYFFTMATVAMWTIAKLATYLWQRNFCFWHRICWMKALSLTLCFLMRVLHTASEQESQYQLDLDTLLNRLFRLISIQFSFKSNVSRIKISGITKISLCFVVLWSKLILTHIIDLVQTQTPFPCVISFPLPLSHSYSFSVWADIFFCSPFHRLEMTFALKL